MSAAETPMYPEAFGAVLGQILAGPKPPAEQDGPPWTHTFAPPPTRRVRRGRQAVLAAADDVHDRADWAQR